MAGRPGVASPGQRELADRSIVCVAVKRGRTEVERQAHICIYACDIAVARAIGLDMLDILPARARSSSLRSVRVRDSCSIAPACAGVVARPPVC